MYLTNVTSKRQYEIKLRDWNIRKYRRHGDGRGSGSNLESPREDLADTIYDTTENSTQTDSPYDGNENIGSYADAGTSQVEFDHFYAQSFGGHGQTGQSISTPQIDVDISPPISTENDCLLVGAGFLPQVHDFDSSTGQNILSNAALPSSAYAFSDQVPPSETTSWVPADPATAMDFSSHPVLQHYDAQDFGPPWAPGLRATNHMAYSCNPQIYLRTPDQFPVPQSLPATRPQSQHAPYYRHHRHHSESYLDHRSDPTQSTAVPRGRYPNNRADIFYSDVNNGNSNNHHDNDNDYHKL